MKYLLLLMMLFTMAPAQAEVTELSLDVRQIKLLRHPLYPTKKNWRGYVGLNWDVETKEKDVYWHNRTYFYGDQAQVRHIGWEYEVGFRLLDNFDLYYYHHSQHTADDPASKWGNPSKFPLEDSLGVRFKFK